MFFSVKVNYDFINFFMFQREALCRQNRCQVLALLRGSQGEILIIFSKSLEVCDADDYMRWKNYVQRDFTINGLCT